MQSESSFSMQCMPSLRQRRFHFPSLCHAVQQDAAIVRQRKVKAKAQMKQVRSSLTLDLSLVHLLRTIEHMTSVLFVV